MLRIREHFTHWRAFAGGAVLLLGLATAAPAQAEALIDPSVGSAPLAHAALSLLDTTYGDAQTPLYFQVVGQGFRPGEAVTVRGSVLAATADGTPASSVTPVEVTANAYGQIAATLDAGGYVQAGDGFIIRASGDQHQASIIDMVAPGSSVRSATGS